jgi:hypothetical protein
MIKEKLKRKLKETKEDILWISVGSLALLIIYYDLFITKRNSRY